VIPSEAAISLCLIWGWLAAVSTKIWNLVISPFRSKTIFTPCLSFPKDLQPLPLDDEVVGTLCHALQKSGAALENAG